MREIKFRAWDVREKKMIPNAHEAYDANLRYEGDEDNGPWGVSSFGIMLDNPEFILMQYTGLKDKNGVEIYEGDIVARYWSDGSVLQQFEVKWFDDKSGYQLTPALLNSTRHNEQTGMTAHGFEVIGNIYENPELLKGDS